MAKITIILRDRQFEALPLSRKIMKEYAQRIAALEKGTLSSMEVADVAFELVFAALRQCNPALTEDEFDELADVVDIHAAYHAVMTGTVPPQLGKVEASR
jgi:hypothetical protein